jgi:hypothetical protein
MWLAELCTVKTPLTLAEARFRTREFANEISHIICLFKECESHGIFVALDKVIMGE